jgi:hypothetical protein
MSSRTTSLTFDLFAKDKTASATFDRFGRNIDQTNSKMKRLGSGFKSVGVAAGKLAVAGVAVAGVALAAFGKSAIDQAREAQKVAGQTEAVIKSTGGAAKVTAGQVADLADALSMKAGIDDEAIQSGENMLLTFRNIRDEAGKGNKIFDRATKASLDLSVAMGKDLSASSLMVGKALNDPIAGMTALGRAGVQLTDQQKANITSMVEQGDTMGAQKVILRELNAEFKGSAAAQATAGEKAKVAWENFQEDVGNKLLPLLDKLAVFFVTTVIPALQQFSAWFSTEAVPVIKQFYADAVPIIKQAAAIIMAAVGQVVAFVEKNWPQIRATIVSALKLIVAVVRDTTAVIVFIWRKWGEDIFAVVKVLFATLVDVIRAGLKIIRGVMDLFTGLLTGDWSLAWKGIKEIFGGIWDAIVAILRGVLKLIGVLIRIAWDGVKDITKGAWSDIKALIGAAVDGIVKLVEAIPGRLGDLGRKMLGVGRDLIGGLKDGITGALSDIGGWIKGNVVDPIVNAVKGFFGISSPSKVFEGIGGHLMSGLFKGLSQSNWLGVAKNIFGGLPEALAYLVKKGIVSIGELPKKALNALQSLGGALGEIFGTLSGGVPVSAILGAGGVGFDAVRQVTQAMQPGWSTGPEWRALVSLIMSESGGNPAAQNPTSSAYGLFQFLDSTWASVGGHKTSDAALQTVYGLRYIAQRYGDPLGAWAFHQAHNWYGKGLEGGIFNRPTLIGVGERGPERVDVTPLHGRGGRRGGGPIYLTLDLGGHSVTGVLRGLVREELEDEFAYQAGGV